MLSGTKRKFPSSETSSTALKLFRRSNGQSSKSVIEIQECDDSESLCEACKGINFEEIFRRKYHSRESAFVCQITTPSPTSQCPACRFFAAMANPSISQDNSSNQHDEGYHLRAYSAFKQVGTRSSPKGVPDSVFLAVVRGNGNVPPIQTAACRTNQKYILSTDTRGLAIPKKFVGRRVLPKIADFSFVEEWIHVCRKRHGDSCYRKTRVTLSGFNIIDCISRKVTHAPKSCSYVALSYLWDQSEIPQFSSTLPKSCPVVVEDAMKVAKQLNFRYLWVDRYCIDQTNESEKHKQIANMDSIYANSDLVIIASALFGLPGVDIFPRVPQPFLQLKNHTLVSALENPHDIINTSKWMSRGWTYQEGLLSQRRLFFTAQQVYFQCMGMHCCESISMPLHFLHGRRQLREDISTYRLYPNASIAKKPEDFITRVNEYSRRSLSFESDILNAVSGVFKIFERMSPPVRQLWGVPLFPMLVVDRYRSSIGTLIAKPNRRIPVSLSLTVGLGWAFDDCQSSVIRRRNFPSWSWAGWSGWGTLIFPHLSFYSQYPTFGLVSDQLEVRSDIYWPRICTEDWKGALTVWNPSDDIRRLVTDLATCAPFLRITSPSTKLSILRCGTGHTVEFLQDLDETSSAPIYRNDPDIRLTTAGASAETTPLVVNAILLAYCSRFTSIRSAGSTFATFLLVEQAGDCYVRVGTASFEFSGPIHSQSLSDWAIFATAQSVQI